MLPLINTYYFLQFYMSLKIDTFLAKIPNEFTEICEIVNSKIFEATDEMARITKEYNKIAEDKSFDEETLKILAQRYDKVKDDNVVEKLNSWQKSMSKALGYHNGNVLLNHIFPYLWYSISIISTFMVYIIKGW